MSADVAETLLEKLRSLPAKQRAEAEDFIDFLRQRAHEESPVRTATRVSEPARRAVRDNPDDCDYVRLTLQIDEPCVVSKVKRLAKSTRLSDTTVVDMALDRLVSSMNESYERARRMAEARALVGRSPTLEEFKDPLAWHELVWRAQGLLK